MFLKCKTLKVSCFFFMRTYKIEKYIRCKHVTQLEFIYLYNQCRFRALLRLPKIYISLTLNLSKKFILCSINSINIVEHLLRHYTSKDDIKEEIIQVNVKQIPLKQVSYH